MQEQAGHEHASTTALYTCVSSDFRTRTLRRALDATAAAAMRPGPMTAKRKVSYQWRLREVMAAAGLFSASDLEPLLAERGITLSSVQVWRLVTQVPERLSLPVLAALCDILDVTPAQLIATRAENVPARRRAASGGTDDQVADLSGLRPARARLRPEK